MSMNKSLLEKVQAIYAVPSMETVNPLNTNEEVYDETPALEAYSSEELELIHQEIVEEYTDSMEAITAELANLELTIMLESAGLSLARFNEYEGEISLEAVKKAVKDGKVTKDSAFKSIVNKIVSLFWTMVDHVTGNYINVLKYGKLVQKYLKRLQSLEVKDGNLDVKTHLSVDTDVFVKIVDENAKTMKKFAGFGKSGNDPKANVTYIYSIFKDLGISASEDSRVKEILDARVAEFKKSATKAKDATVIDPKQLKTKLVENGNAMLKALNSVAIKGFRDQIKAAKAKLKSGADSAKAVEGISDDQKKAINADLKRCIALISAYKSYNKACIGIVKKNVNDYLNGVGHFIDAVNKGSKTEKKEDKE